MPYALTLVARRCGAGARAGCMRALTSACSEIGIVRGNKFIHCDKGLHIDNRGMGGEKPSCLGEDMVGLKAAMGTPAWAKYGLSAQMSECLHLQHAKRLF